MKWYGSCDGSWLSTEKKHTFLSNLAIFIFMVKKSLNWSIGGMSGKPTIRGVCFACDMSIYFSLGKTLSEQSWSAIFQLCCLAIVPGHLKIRQMAAIYLWFTKRQRRHWKCNRRITQEWIENNGCVFFPTAKCNCHLLISFFSKLPSTYQTTFYFS